jgi:hypothetical protein
VKRNWSLSIAAAVALLGLIAGCAERPKPYGRERQLMLTTRQPQVWAIAPALNLSGQGEVDPLLQADLVYQQLQQVQRLTVIPVNRVAEVYAGLQIDRVRSPEQAALVCDLLGADALLIATVTAYDPYNPPKMGASLQLLPAMPRQRDREPDEDEAPPPPPKMLQAVGMFDAANGSVRDAVLQYAAGRNDPLGPLGPKEYFVSMDRYSGFVYHQLITDLLGRVRSQR